MQWIDNVFKFQSLTGYEIITDKRGNVYVAGIYNAGGWSALPAGTTSYVLNGVTLPAYGGDDLFYAKFSTNGDQQWIVGSGGSGGDYTRGIALDKAQRQLYAAGNTNSPTMTLGPFTFVSDVSNNFINSLDVKDGKLVSLFGGGVCKYRFVSIATVLFT